MPRLRAVIFGRQGAGKGTQCVRLSERYGAPHISTGDMLRAAVQEGTEFGRKADAYMSVGNLVPDDVILGIVRERLSASDAVMDGFLLDGFPRTETQAEELMEITGNSGIDVVINLDVSLAIVTERMKLRGREDDTPEGIARRLELYEQETAPVLRWFRGQGLLEEVDGVGSEDEVFARLAAAVDGRLAAN